MAGVILQGVLVDPANAKGKVYQVTIVGGGMQAKELPEAAETYEGIILMYTGETDTNFTHGYIYECVKSGSSYVWQQLDVQPSGE